MLGIIAQLLFGVCYQVMGVIFSDAREIASAEDEEHAQP
jgi:hypothetical protein